MFGFFKRTPPFELKDITDFDFKYSTGNMMYAYVFYKIVMENGVYKAIIKPNQIADENAFEIEIDSGFVAELERFLLLNGVEKWNGFKKSDNRVLDGKDFKMYMRNKQGRHFDAWGYMKWPENYDNVKKGLDNLFGSLINKTLE